MSRPQHASELHVATLLAGRLTDLISPRRRYLTDAQGKPTAVVVPIAECERLLEDVHDLAAIAERRDDDTLSEKQLRHRLSEGGAV
jgi:hypothetical protein